MCVLRNSVALHVNYGKAIYLTKSRRFIAARFINGTTSPNAHSAVSNGNTLGLAFTHFFTDNIALTLDGGIPPEFTLYGKGTLASFGEIGNAKQWSPALVAKYFFGDAQDKFRPFVGAGASYIWYSDVHLSQGFQTY